MSRRLSGVQALERLRPILPPAPGRVERREFEYVRHGTRTFILGRDVAVGEVAALACGPTRTEADFLAHIQGVVATDPAATRCHFVVANLNTHQCEALVRSVATAPGCADDLFHYTPKHCPWRNQVELWRKALFAPCWIDSAGARRCASTR